MLTMSPYLEFANSLIDKYRGFHEAYTQISLIHPERASENPEPVQAQQNFVTNLYRIQNIREENYLYTKNLTFLTELLVKKFQRNLYPSVEKQVEKVIREEFSDVRKDTVENFTKVIHQFVEKEGAEKIFVLREKLLEKENNTEIKWQKEQEILFRKLENIYQSSSYHSRHIQNADQRKIVQKHLLSNEQTLVFPTIREENKEERTQPVSQSEILEQWTGILNRSLTMQSTEIFNQITQKQVRQNFRAENVTNIRNEVHQESVLNYHVDGEEHHQHQEVSPRQEVSAREDSSLRQEFPPKQEETQSRKHIQSPELHPSETELKYLQEHTEGKHVKSEHAENKYERNEPAEKEHVKNGHAENQQIREVWDVQKPESVRKGAAAEPEIWDIQKLESMRKDAGHTSENVTNIRNEVHQESVLNYHVDGEEYHQPQELLPRQEISAREDSSLRQELPPKQEETQSRKHIQSPELHPSETELKYLQEHTEGKHVKSEHAENKYERNEPEEKEHVKNGHAENQQIREVWDVQKPESVRKGAAAEPEIWDVQKLESMRKDAGHPSEHVTNIRNEVHQESVLNYHVDGEEHHQPQEVSPRQEVFIREDSSLRQEFPPKQEETQSRKHIQSPELHPSETELKYLPEHTEGKHAKSEQAESKYAKNEHAENKHVKNGHAENQQIREVWDVQKPESVRKGAAAEPEIWDIQKLESMRKDAGHPSENITNIRNEVHQESVLNYHVDGEEHHQPQEVSPRQEVFIREDSSLRQEFPPKQEETQSRKHIQSPELHPSETELKYLQEHTEGKHVKSEHAENKYERNEPEEKEHVKNGHAENQQIREVWDVQKPESVRKGAAAEPEIWDVQKLESMRKGVGHPSENVTNIRNEFHQESVLNYHVDGEEHHQHQEVSPRQEVFVREDSSLRQEFPPKQEETQSRKHIQSPELHPSETELKYLPEHTEGKHAKSEQAESKYAKNEPAEKEHVTNGHAENQQIREVWNVQKLESMHKDAVHLTENIFNTRNEFLQESVLNYHVDGDEQHRHQELSDHTAYETSMGNKTVNKTFRNNLQKFQHMPASMVYSEESVNSGKNDDPEISKLQKQVDEVVKDLRTIEEKTVVRKKEITAKQQEIVKEVLKNDSEVWSFGNGRDALQREVHRILEDQMPESINRIAGKVYRRLEKELKMERGRRGMN